MVMSKQSFCLAHIFPRHTVRLAVFAVRNDFGCKFSATSRKDPDWYSNLPARASDAGFLLFAAHTAGQVARKMPHQPRFLQTVYQKIPFQAPI